MNKRICCLTMMTMQKLFSDRLCMQALIISRRANTVTIQYNEKKILPKKCQNLMYIQQGTQCIQVDCWRGLPDFSDHKGRSLANESFLDGKNSGHRHCSKISSQAWNYYCQLLRLIAEREQQQLTATWLTEEHMHTIEPETGQCSSCWFSQKNRLGA